MKLEELDEDMFLEVPEEVILIFLCALYLLYLFFRKVKIKLF